MKKVQIDISAYGNIKDIVQLQRDILKLMSGYKETLKTAILFNVNDDVNNPYEVWDEEE